MGKVLSTVGRAVARPFKLYNIEARAHKVISKEKPALAPRYPYAIKDMERADQEDPDFMKKQKTKDVHLDTHLKDIYVVSHDPEAKPLESAKGKNPDRPLPVDRNSSDYPEYGYVEPDISEIPRGKFTLKQAVKFISEHQSQPDVYTIQDIARDYKIDEKVAENVVKHFSMFDLHLPKKPEVEDETTLLNVYEKWKQITHQFQKTRPKEFREKVEESSTKTPTVMRHDDFLRNRNKKRRNDT